MTDKPKRWWLTPCGLNCSFCPIHLRTDGELNYYRQRNVDPEKIRCDGCRSDRTGNHWSPDCELLQCCVDQRGFEFCAECPEFPCSIINKWAQDYDHHKQAVRRLAEMKESGIQTWLTTNGY